MVVRERERERERESTNPYQTGKGTNMLDPSQTLEENLHKLHGMKYMRVMDVKEAFQNIPLTLRSSLMTTMYTPWGRHRWTRLPFGISSASEQWQCRIHMVLEGLQIISITDDILVPGCGATDMEARVDD